MSTLEPRSNGRTRPAREGPPARAPRAPVVRPARVLSRIATAALALLAAVAIGALLDLPFVPRGTPDGWLDARGLLLLFVAAVPLAYALAADRLLAGSDMALPAMAADPAAPPDLASLATQGAWPMVVTDATGRVRWSNSAFVRALGYLPEDFEDDPLWDTVLSDRSSAAERERLAHALRTHEAARCELALRTREGHLEWYEVAVHPLPAENEAARGGFALALTEARARIELRERHALLMDTLPAGVVIRDARGRIVEANDTAARLLEIERSQLIGRTTKDPDGITVDEHGHPLPEDRHPGLMALSTGEPQLGMTLGIPLANGLMRWLRVNAAPLRDAEGELTGSISCLIDKTSSYVERRVLKVAMDSAQAGLWTWNCRAGTEPVLMDRRWLATLGYAVDGTEVPHPGWLEFVHPEDRDLVRSHLARALERPPRPVRVEFRMRDQAGHDAWMLCAGGLVLRDTARRPATLAGVLLNVTPRKELETALARETSLDPLTGLANRRGWLSALTEALTRRRADAEYHFAVLLLDIDRFKLVNDSLGVDAGDDLLRQIAERLRRVLRGGDEIARLEPAENDPHLARLGGDEFAVLLEPLREPADADVVSRRLLDAIARPYRVANRRIHVTASVGVVGDGPEVPNVETLLRDADLAMYEAKRHGRARAVRFDAEMHARALRRLDLESGLRRALEFEGEIWVAYQPIVEMRSHRIIGIEALARWEHPYRGEIPPGDFIPVAEDSALIVPVGRLLLKQACADMARWIATYGEAAPRWIAVNLSRTQCEDPHLVEDVRLALQANRLEPWALRIEVTESLPQDLGSHLDGLITLRELGVTVSIDDFGTGYSSLASLRRLPVDVVKVDREMISEIDTNPAQRALVDATLRVARSLNLDVVAEGIERPEQAEALVELGCTYGQGHLYGEATPASKLELLLEAARLLPGAGDGDLAAGT